MNSKNVKKQSAKALANVSFVDLYLKLTQF